MDTERILAEAGPLGSLSTVSSSVAAAGQTRDASAQGGRQEPSTLLEVRDLGM